jgi:hypothetical protein
VSEQIVSVTSPVGLHARVRGTCTPVVALAVVRIVDPDGYEEPFDVIRAVTVGAASEDGLVDLAACHDSAECSGRATFREAGRVAA